MSEVAARRERALSKSIDKRLAVQLRGKCRYVYKRAVGTKMIPLHMCKKPAKWGLPTQDGLLADYRYCDEHKQWDDVDCTENDES